MCACGGGQHCDSSGKFVGITNLLYKGLAKEHCSGVMGADYRDRCKPLKLTPNLPIGKWQKY